MASKYLDYDGLLYFWAKIKAAFVAKETGKGLSTNDYTTAEKNKLSGIVAGAQVNVIETVQKNGVALTVTDKTVNVTVPTTTSELTNNSDFVSDSAYVHTDNNFTTTLKDKLDGIEAGATVDDHKWNDVALSKTTQTATDSDYVPRFTGLSTTTAYLMEATTTPTARAIAKYNVSKMLSSTTPAANNNSTLVATTSWVRAHVSSALPTIDNAMSDTSTNPVQNNTIKSYVDSAIASITGVSFEIVTTLPETGTNGVIYLVSNGGTSPNVYDEYIWIASTTSFEKIGSTAVDLSGYWSKTDLVAITNTEIDTVVAT